MILVWFVSGVLLALMIIATMGHLPLHDWKESAEYAGAAVLILLAMLWMMVKTPPP